ncbi:MAG: aminopeptidase P family protein, partial [Myxococcota bacterium]
MSDIDVTPKDQETRRLRLSALRRAIADAGVDAYLIPLADEFQGEYVPTHAQRLAWLTGFTGSAGLAIVTSAAAGMFVDGRYTLQVVEQTPAELYAHRGHTAQHQAEWLTELGDAAPEVIGYDPWLHTPSQLEGLRTRAARSGITLKPLEGNLIDGIWDDQPAPPSAPIRIHPMDYAGVSHADKLTELAGTLQDAGHDAAVLTLPDSICWLLNVRGADVPHNPVVLAMGILHSDATLELFLDPSRVDDALATHLGASVTVRPREQLGGALDALTHQTVRIDPKHTASWVLDRLERARIEVARDADPCLLPKATKNPVELEGMRRAHRRDGVAIVKMLKWLDDHAPRGEVDELSAVATLLTFRQQDDTFIGDSFATIAGAGPNGAIVHYRATPESNRRLGADEMFLLDSGGQYVDGTTDITRTIFNGEPNAEHKDRFTRVLKGHIALSSLIFPEGTTGSAIDAFARSALWQVGVDYAHGTGHGVGSHLAVHEGPQRVSKHPNKIELEPGMVVSNEPGYYKSDAFGIRIENLIAVTAPAPVEGGELEMMQFEDLTLAPIQRKLIEVPLLSHAERAWIDTYHARVLRELS